MIFFKQLDLKKGYKQFENQVKTQLTVLICNISRTRFVEFLGHEYQNVKKITVS